MADAPTPSLNPTLTALNRYPSPSIYLNKANAAGCEVLLVDSDTYGGASAQASFKKTIGMCLSNPRTIGS
jgi:hypothetical protein